MTAVNGPFPVSFGDFELDVEGFTLRRNGRAVKLERQPMELLLLLVDRRGPAGDADRDRRSAVG